MILYFLACGYDYTGLSSALSALQSTSTTTVSIEADWISFIPETRTSEIGFILYPGGKVDPNAYAPILKILSEEGIISYVVNVPAGLAILDTRAAVDIMDFHNDEWVVGGHSLGGVAAADMSIEDSRIVGLSLWASYPADGNDISQESLAVQSIVGSDDGIINWENWNDAEALLPSSTDFVSLEGGNHSFFGDYGLQEDDNLSTLNKEEQWNQTSATLMNMIFDLQ